ncbi:MAG: hypothetical protein IPG00_22535 [Saprospiraceae bacterium]|nr:hypothetical protein [Saprospiraceae bacterium]
MPLLLRSSASIVLENEGADGSLAMESISALWAVIAASKAGLNVHL